VGQKTHPYGLRLGIVKPWKSRWFATKNFAELLQEDLLIRRYTLKRLEHAGVSDIQILRAPKKVTIDIHTAKPGIVIGRKGAEVDKLKEELQLLSGKEILLNIIEVKKPELSAALVAQSIAQQLEGRVSFRRAMKKAVAAAMKSGAEGIKVMCGGRLGGAEIARSEKYHRGRVPLHTLRADIDYSNVTAHTTYGCIGVKVWICRGEILEKEKVNATLLGEVPGEREERSIEAQQPRRQRGGRGEGRRPFAGGKKPSAKALDKSKRRERSGNFERREQHHDQRPPDSTADRGRAESKKPPAGRKEESGDSRGAGADSAKKEDRGRSDKSGKEKE
jgi:small subunit ribosomal protein S3